MFELSKPQTSEDHQKTKELSFAGPDRESPRGEKLFLSGEAPDHQKATAELHSIQKSLRGKAPWPAGKISGMAQKLVKL